MPNLFQNTPFTAHSGSKLNFKIDCDFLTDEDLNTLAIRYAKFISSEFRINEIIGIPRGGLRFAKALTNHITILKNPIRHVNLIVDDVLTTGKSFLDFRQKHYPNHLTGIIGVVIFARGPCPYWVTSLFEMNEYLDC